MQPGYFRQPTIERLPNLLAELKAGHIRIPPFQREFVWTGEQRLHLLDSVRKGLPIGSLLAWRTTRLLPCEERLGRYQLSLPVGGGAPVQYLLDGRQRMTALFSALAGGLWTRNEGHKPEGEEENSPDGSPWAIWCDLDEGELTLEESEVGAQTRLPLSLLLDDFGFDEWLAKNGGSRERYARARALKAAINDYQVPIIPLATDDVGFVTLSFKRVNAGGTPVSDMDMARALSWSERFDLKDHVDEVHEELTPLGWGEIDDDDILKTLAVSCGLEPTNFDVEKLANILSETPVLLSQASKYLASAVQILAGVGFVGPRLLPYQGALTFAARAVYKAKEKGQELNVKELQAWIVETCITERFGNAPPHTQRDMWRELLVRIGLEQGKSQSVVRQVRPYKRFSMAWARSRITAMVLAKQTPKRSDGTDLSDALKLLARLGTHLLPSLFARGASGLPRELWPKPVHSRDLHELLQGPANRVVCLASDVPSLRARLLEGDPELLKSHLIDKASLDALESGSLFTFLERRKRAIRAAETAWLRQWVSEKRVTMPDD